MTRSLPPLLTTALAALLFTLPASSHAEDGFTELFNGKDLTGWDGNPAFWSVENGVIVGQTKAPEDLPYNQFLIWRGGKLKNFELHAKIRVEGNNSGIQYRSKEMTEVGKWSIGGYQCDIHPNPPYNGMFYEERGRGIIAQNGQSVAIDPAGRKWLVSERNPVTVDVAKWHDYRIVAQGNHIRHEVDGHLTAELFDYDEGARSLEGILAFQIHKGPPMRAEIKDIRLKALPDGGITPFSKAVIPNDVQEIVKPAPKGSGGQKGKAAPQPQPKTKGPNQKAGKGQAKKAAPAKPTPQVGPAIGENIATPVSRIKVPDGFKVELLYSVPGTEQGSWIALCVDDRDRIYASDQYGGLYRFPAPPAGQPLRHESVEKVPVELQGVNGMCFSDGVLYLGVNDYEQKSTSGFYKISDSDGDDKLDTLELLRAMESRGDHGIHAVVPIPGSQDFYLVCGNNTLPTEVTPNSPVPPIWGEDHLLTRMPDGRGHNRHVLAPGGTIYRVTRDGKTFSRFASGFRNIYDAAINHEGELFTYDADMEYDFNTSWYRPTRINHVVSGGEFGWRNGAGKFPEFYPDNLPAAINIGPGSPTGVAFGYGAKFPARYQNALFILDWSWGKIYAVQMEPNGASYRGVKEDFLSGAPFPVTDVIIHPKDGAMYLTIGGRRVQSGVYRISYTGGEDTSPAKVAHTVTPEAKLRHELEKYHGAPNPAAIEIAWPHLSHPDRFVRWAARTVLEHQPAKEWAEKALSETDPLRKTTALLALARVDGVCPYHRIPAKPLGVPRGEPEIKQAPVPEGATPTPPVDTAMRDRILNALLELDYGKLDEASRFTLLRTVEITLNRFDGADESMQKRLIAKLDPAFPSPSFQENWMLCEILAWLQAPDIAAKGIALLKHSNSQEEQIEFARSLRFVTKGWTKELHSDYLKWFLKAASYRGGASFEKFLQFIRTDALATFTEAEKTELAGLIAETPKRVSAIENLGEIFTGRTPTVWTLEELSKAAQTGMTHRNFDNGRKMFSAAACYACHRFRDGGGMTGPDLTGAGGRYSPHDLLDQIINPSKEINEQFVPIIATLEDGSQVSGVIVNLNGDNVALNTDLSDPNQQVHLDRKKVKSMEVSKISPMPPMLLNLLTKDEVLDLVAYILSGGDAKNEMFKK